MEPQDDPEARIRELERPLTDVARTSELSSGQYSSAGTYLSPPMPPAYGAPAPYAAAPRKANAGVPWWLFAVIAVGVVVAAVVAAFMFTRGESGMTPGRHPGVSGGGSVTTPPPDGTPSVSGIGENKTIACNDNAVSVSGVKNTVTITGHCLRLTVSGMQNEVTVDTADIISGSGFENQVTYHSGSPQIDNAGVNNVVEQG
jgi:hypothetical protein